MPSCRFDGRPRADRKIAREMRPGSGAKKRLYAFPVLASKMPRPTFSRVKNFIFLKPTTCVFTRTSPWKMLCAVHLGALVLVQDLHLCVIDRIREVVAIDATHVSFPPVVIEALHLILPRIVKIDCLFVQRGQSGREGHLRDYLVITRNIDHHEIVAANGAKAYCICRVRIGCPVPGATGQMQEPALLKKAAQLTDIVRPEFLAVANRQLKGGATEVI